MSEGTTGTTPGRTRSTGRGNPAPRRALSRVSPLPADDAEPAEVADRSHPPQAERGAGPRPAAAPGGTQGRDLLIPSRGKKGDGSASAGKGQPTVPSLAELMPPAAPSGRRQGGAGSARVGSSAEPARPAKEDKKDVKLVELVVTLPKPLRKRLRERAAEMGLTPEETVAQLVEVWIDG